MELKIPLPDSDTPSRTSIVNDASLEGSPVPDMTPNRSHEPDPLEYGFPHSTAQDCMDEAHVEGEYPAGEETDPRQLHTERPETPGSQTVRAHSPTILADVKDLVRLERYHRDHTASLQHTLDNLMLLCGFNGRLVPSLAIAHRAMADFYQDSDPGGFAEIYQTCESLAETYADHSSKQLRTRRLHQPLSDQGHPPQVSWFGRLPQDCQDFILDFISQLRSDRHFLASRLSALSTEQFIELTIRPHVSRKPQSVFQVHFHRRGGNQNPGPSRRESAPILARLRCFNQGDPFFALFHGVFNSTCSPGTEEHFLRAQVWSAACAKVINEGKPGSDEFTTIVLDAFSDSSTWCLKPHIETYIVKVIQEGAFLINLAQKEPTKFKEPLEIRNANAAIASSKFFDKALKDVLAILLDTVPFNMLPEGLLDFIRSVLNEIPSVEIRNRARNFIVSKWYISSFVSSHLTNPEAYGMMMHYHIAPNVRKSLLGEITSRLQRQMFDVIFSWKSTSSKLDPEMDSMVRQLLDRFDFISPDTEQDGSATIRSSVPRTRSLMLSAHDVAGLLRSLYPNMASSVSSANPSTAGSATLVPDSLQRRKGDNSILPSLSDTSVANIDAYTRRLPYPWMKNFVPRHVEADPDATALQDHALEPSKESYNGLARTYSCLTGQLQPISSSVSDVPTTDWALFSLDGEGKVHFPAADQDGSEPQVSVVTGRNFTTEGGKESTTDLKLAIKQLFAQEGHTNSVPVGYARLGEVKLDEPSTGLQSLIETAIDRAGTACDYQDMHYWWQLQKLWHSYEDRTHRLLQSILHDCEQNIKASKDLAVRIEEQLYTFSSLREAQNSRLAYVQQQREALRLKMWYTSDVQHSSTFEDAAQVTQALRAMANTSRSKQPSGVANWAKNRLRNVKGQDRWTAQTLEALTEPNEHSGTSKLNDEQVERTTRWLTRHSVENFCRGEERIHRFCLEVRKCVNKLTGPTLLESPVLWSSRLFEQEKRAFNRKTQGTHEQRSPLINGNTSGAINAYSSKSFPTGSFHQRQAVPQPQRDSHWVLTQQIGQVATVDHINHIPKLDNPFPKEPIRSLPYCTSIPLGAPTEFPGSSGLFGYALEQGHSVKNLDGLKRDFLEEMKKNLCSLILSDLGYLLWHSGTETDAWVTQGSLDESLVSLSDSRKSLDGTMKPERFSQKRCLRTIENNKSELKVLLMAATAAQQDTRSRWQIKHWGDRNPTNNSPRTKDNRKPAELFPYRMAYKNILDRFSLSQDPHTKLWMLQELEQLVSHSIKESTAFSCPHPRSGSGCVGSPKQFNLRSILVPRTKATSFEEVIANCTERRAGTMKFSNPPKTFSNVLETESFGTDEIVNRFLSIFRDSYLRPRTLFRDLQYIAALIPAEVLDQTPQGKAFWDAGLAALALKQELCDAMIARATDITSYHISASASSPDRPVTSLQNGLIHTSLGDAAPLWIIAAKEGSATAARELGLLYLTHPELLPRTTLQSFSKPKEVFKMVASGKEGTGTLEEGRLDPVTFAVVFHWMEVAANGGDRDARDFLRGNGEWGTGR
ncbi:MAG: hypothetical protein Q9201_003677 [Fulgogasparrea decipioides]